MSPSRSSSKSSASAAGVVPDDPLDESAGRIARRHLVFGWWTLLLFLTLGLALESLIGLRSRWFLEDPGEIRRLMWRLAHAHGTLLALVNVAFAVTLPLAPAASSRLRAAASPCLLAAGTLLPLGFFLGGLYVYSSDTASVTADPGLGIVLVPVGGALLLLAVLLTALSLHRTAVRE